MKINLSELSIAKIRELLISGGFSARELVEIYHCQIKEKDKNIRAYLEIFYLQSLYNLFSFSCQAHYILVIIQIRQ